MADVLVELRANFLTWLGIAVTTLVIVLVAYWCVMLIRRKVPPVRSQEDVQITSEARVTELASKVARNAVRDELKSMRQRVYWGIGGFTAFLVVGAITDMQWKPWLHDTLKSPDDVYTDIKPKLANLTLDDIRTARDAIFDHVVDEFATGDNYNGLFSGPFLDQLEDAVSRNLVRTFVTPDRVTAEDVMRYGAIPLSAIVEQIGEPIGLSICNVSISNEERQAIVVIPAAMANSNPIPWLGCTERYPNVTRLSISVRGRLVDNVSLVGVQRNGREDRLEVRVTREVAQHLGIEGEPYTGRAPGMMRIMEAVD